MNLSIRQNRKKKTQVVCVISNMTKLKCMFVVMIAMLGKLFSKKKKKKRKEKDLNFFNFQGFILNVSGLLKNLLLKWKRLFVLVVQRKNQKFVFYFFISKKLKF